MARIVPYGELHPSQLYISARKLRDVMEWFDFDDRGTARFRPMFSMET